MCVDPWAGVTYLRYTVLTSPKKGETAVHCCNPALSVLVRLVSRNVFQVLSALRSIVCSVFKQCIPVQVLYFLSEANVLNENLVDATLFTFLPNNRLKKGRKTYIKREYKYIYIYIICTYIICKMDVVDFFCFVFSLSDMFKPFPFLSPFAELFVCDFLKMLEKRL